MSWSARYWRNKENATNLFALDNKRVGLAKSTFGKEQKAQESLTPDTMPIGFGHGPSRANDTPGIKHWQMK